MGRQIRYSRARDTSSFVKFTVTPIKDAFLVHMERLEDNRGFFARIWSASEFAAHGLVSQFEQCSVSCNKARGTLRGMHYQISPHVEAKLVRCTRGTVYDVIVDARAGSPTEGVIFGVQLTDHGPTMVYVPEGVAHGFITLTDDSEVSYSISKPYSPEHQAGFRWDDAEVAIKWPLRPVCISERDAHLPSFADRRMP